LISAFGLFLVSIIPNCFFRATLRLCINSQGGPKVHASQLNGSMKEPNMFHNYETEKVTRKASDAAENLQL